MGKLNTNTPTQSAGVIQCKDRKFLKNHLLFKSFLGLLFFWLIACEDNATQNGCFPNVQINQTINLTLPQYLPLNNAGGWAYVNGVGAGTNGLIVYNSGNDFIAYDRNAPHICPSAGSVMEVEGFRIVCPQDGAEWILSSGQPVNDATKGQSPVKYPTSLNGNTLTIYN